MTLLSYGQVHNVVAHLPMVVRNVRSRRSLSYRQAADEIGVAHTTLFRLELGREHVSVGSVLLILAWLDRQRTATASAALTAGFDSDPGQLRSTVKRNLTGGGLVSDGRLAADVPPVQPPYPPQRPAEGSPGSLDGGW